MKKRHHIIIFFTLCIVGGMSLAYVLHHAFSSGKNTNETPVETTSLLEKTITSIVKPSPSPSTAHIMFVGDLMVDRGVEQSVEKNMGGDFGKLFDHLSLFKDADAVFLNLEGPVTDTGPDVGSRFSFAMNKKILTVLHDFHVAVVSFANNHVGDRSTQGFLTTLNNLDTSGILFTGAGRNRS